MKLDISDEMIAERRGGSGPMPRNMPKWMALTITKIDLANKWVGNIVCWLVIPLTFAMVYEVLARKLFNAPTMWAYDMSRFLYGALFMLGAGYALSKGVHIRADFLYSFPDALPPSSAVTSSLCAGSVTASTMTPGRMSTTFPTP